MKITTKLAKEIFSGNFTNVDLKELQKDNKAKERKYKSYMDLKDAYIKPEYIKLKHFKGLNSLEIIKCPGEKYGGRCKGILMTDVLRLSKLRGSWYLDISREVSIDYKKQVYFSFDEDTHEEITKNIIKSLEVGLK